MFHFQDPVVDWPECVKYMPNGYVLKAVDNVQMLDAAKRRQSTVRTILRHWYTAQVPDSELESVSRRGSFKAHADYLRKLTYAQHTSIPRPLKGKAHGITWLQIPGRSPEENQARARSFFDSFIDGTFLELAHQVDFVEEWNEYYGNNMPADERQRFILWSQAVARVWQEEYRCRPELSHIRLILANTAVGNDIPVEVAAAAAEHDCVIGYHSYWPTRLNETPEDSWKWYEGRWTELDASFRSRGYEVDWALTEAGPVLYHGDWPRVTLGPNDGWRHHLVHDADVGQFKIGIKRFLDRWREWNNLNGGRCLNPVLFTSGFAGWGDFQIHQPHLNDIGDFVLRWSTTSPPPPPLPPPVPYPGSPRIQYRRVYNVLPESATEEQALAVFAAARARSLESVGYSYDDAGLGALVNKTAKLYGIALAKRQQYLGWFAEFYPGTRVEFHDLPG